jgi:hypothetical protein
MRKEFPFGDYQGKTSAVVTGEMKSRIENFDWSKTQLGVMESWCDCSPPYRAMLPTSQAATGK